MGGLIDATATLSVIIVAALLLKDAASSFVAWARANGPASLANTSHTIVILGFLGFASLQTLVASFNNPPAAVLPTPPSGSGGAGNQPLPPVPGSAPGMAAKDALNNMQAGNPSSSLLGGGVAVHLTQVATPLSGSTVYSSSSPKPGNAPSAPGGASLPNAPSSQPSGVGPQSANPSATQAAVTVPPATIAPQTAPPAAGTPQRGTPATASDPETARQPSAARAGTTRPQARPQAARPARPPQRFAQPTQQPVRADRARPVITDARPVVRSMERPRQPNARLAEDAARVPDRRAHRTAPRDPGDAIMRFFSQLAGEDENMKDRVQWQLGTHR